jgi:YVTN family beta-propeller protein
MLLPSSRLKSSRLKSLTCSSQIIALSLVTLLTACGGGGGSAPTSPPPNNPVKGANFTTFETGQVRPLALSPDGNRLFAANTPNGTLEIYAIDAGGLSHESTVAVGMEPSAVAAPSNNEVWVVNHLSDSVSVVDVSVTPPVVKQTLLVGDEPRDIVFAGTNNKFAFITTAHRGQNGPDDNPVNAQLDTPGVGRADVWVFDTTALGNTIGGDPTTVLTLFGDTPRALTVSPDGNTVYAAVYFSGNRTTTLGEDNFNKRGPTQSADSVTQPDTGLIVQFDGTDWVDDTGNTTDLNGTSYNSKVPFNLPDYDVFTIDASLATPAVSGTPFTGVGTTLFNMATNPASGAVYVANTHALNLTRFEGPGNAASTVRGHFVESRITVIKGGVVSPRHLNKHINYAVFPGTQSERDLALANPLDMAVSGDGNTLYVAGFGSQKIGVYNTTALENDTFTPAAANLITLSAGGPSGVVLDETRNRLYVLTRFDNGLSIIDTGSNNETQHLTLYNPEPDHVVAGRRFLYDAKNTSSHGDSSCALCHVFGDFDGLAWDLGNPDDTIATNPNQFVNPALRPPTAAVFHPMKGPMSTQSLRGLAGNGPMHWRGDRVGAASGDSLELRAFKDFNVAFPGLVGNDAELPDADMQAFAEFALELTYPPNPIRALDNQLTATQLAGKNIFTDDLTTGLPTPNLTCNLCHRHDPANGNFGTAGLSTVEGPDISQQFKVPHLRNMYQKVGKFGNSGKFATDATNYGDQIKGFGFMHDGGMDTLDKFLQGSVFVFDAMDQGLNDIKRQRVVEFVMVMDSEMAPIMGQQVTLTASSPASVGTRIDLLRARALVDTPRAECDLVVKGVIGGISRGYLMQGDGSYQSDRAMETLTDTQLRNLVNSNGQTLTFTCAPPGSGTWMGIDHDEDGIYDRDEIDNGTDPLAV